MPTALVTPTFTANQPQTASFATLAQQSHDQHAELHTLLETLGTTMCNVLAELRTLNNNGIVVQGAINIDADGLATEATLAAILAGLPTAGGAGAGVDLTTVEARLQALLDAIGPTGTWTLRDVLDWWRLNFEDFDGALAPYHMLARQQNIYEALYGEGASYHGDEYLYGKVAAIYEALTGEGSGVDLTTIESRLQSIRDAMPSDPATEGTLTNTLAAVVALQPQLNDVLNALGGGSGWTVRDVLNWISAVSRAAT
jgi:hypothetical protein